jgi:hypothetical protein
MRATDFLTLTGWPVDLFPEKRAKLCNHMEAYVALSTPATLVDVSREIIRQHEKWGVQNHPDFHPRAGTGENRSAFYGLPTEAIAKTGCEWDATDGTVNWTRILTEEVCEAVEAPDEEKLRKELVQVAAVAVSWIDAIDRRKAQATPQA